ncbi:MAG: hypothetical protein KAG61_04005 [Bacteriovoracaceae bacterium]|nr:hypothetical protein [Bacteriovoracaceae bacterium]
MVTELSKNEPSMLSLINLGVKGLYPLFHKEWIEDAGENRRALITGQDRINNRAIAKSLSKHQTLDRKRTVLMALSDEERQTFIVAFIQKVEMKILESRPEMQ